jgi:selT/selW/selH-like putative selenoprotein
MMTFFTIYLGGNMISGQLVSSGAFEIFIEGELIFSKLQTGRMPSLDEITRAIDRYQN